MNDQQPYLEFIHAVETRAHALRAEIGKGNTEQSRELAIDLVQFCMDTRYQFTTRTKEHGEYNLTMLKPLAKPPSEHLPRT